MFVSVPVQRRPSHRWAVPLLFAAMWLAFAWARMQPDEARRSLWLAWGALGRGLAGGDAWLAALRDGGRLAVVERSGAVGKAVLYVKGQGDALSRKVLFDSAPPVLAELAPAPTFAL